MCLRTFETVMSLIFVLRANLHLLFLVLILLGFQLDLLSRESTLVAHQKSTLCHILDIMLLSLSVNFAQIHL